MDPSYVEITAQVLKNSLPTDDFLIDLAVQYRGSFSKLFIKALELFNKNRDVAFLKSLGYSFEHNQIEKITRKKLEKFKREAIYSFIPEITDNHFQRFYGEIILEACNIKNQKKSLSYQTLESIVNALNKREKLPFDIEIDHSRQQVIFNLQFRYSISNLIFLLYTDENQYILLEEIKSRSLILAKADHIEKQIFKVKEIKLASLKKVQNNREEIKKEFLRTLGRSIYRFKKTRFHKTIEFSNDFPIIKCLVILYKLDFELDDISYIYSVEGISKALDAFINCYNGINELILKQKLKPDETIYCLISIIKSIINKISTSASYKTNSIGILFAEDKVDSIELAKQVSYLASKYVLLP